MSSLEILMRKSLKSSIKKIKSGETGLKEIEKNHYLNGTFKQLCDQKLLQEVLFPGISTNNLNEYPKNLCEVLNWENFELDINSIVKNATEVLTNIKLKGEKQGDIMDEMTESILLPQIAQEALSKGIVDAVRKLNRKVSQLNSKISNLVADPSKKNKDQELNQLDNDVVMILNQNTKPFAIQEEFMGDEWVDLIRKDVIRFIREEKLSMTNKYGEVMTSQPSVEVLDETSQKGPNIFWIDPSNEICKNYPAIEELISQLHLLPYELNEKLSNELKLEFLEPVKGSTMLLYFEEYSSQIPRIDSREDGSDQDSGIRVTCSYHILLEEEDDPKPNIKEDPESISNSQTQQDRMNMISLDSNDRIGSFEIKNDLLSLHFSAKVKNERTLVKRKYAVIAFFIHGKSE